MGFFTRLFTRSKPEPAPARPEPIYKDYPCRYACRWCDSDIGNTLEELNQGCPNHCGCCWAVDTVEMRYPVEDAIVSLGKTPMQRLDNNGVPLPEPRY